MVAMETQTLHESLEPPFAAKLEILIAGVERGIEEAAEGRQVGVKHFTITAPNGAVIVIDVAALSA